MVHQLTQQLDLKQKLSLAPVMAQSLSILSLNLNDILNLTEEIMEQNPFVSHEKELLNRLIKEDKLIVRRFWWNQSDESLPQITAPSSGMEEYLRDQLLLEECKGKKRQALMYLIQNLTNQGYLKCLLEEIQSLYQLSSLEAKGILDILQGFEPAGIGARSLSECLSLQLRSYSKIPPFVEPIIKYHLEEVASQDLLSLTSIFNCSVQEISRAIDFIKSLNPYPVTDFSNEDSVYIAPDINVYFEEGEVIITVNDAITSGLVFEESMKEVKLEEEADLQQLKNDALLLKFGIEKRAATLYKVSFAIIKAQPTFIEHGITKLNPLKLTDVAKIVGFHESTVHRTIRDKYVSTPHGMFQLKNFFTRGLKNKEGIDQNIQGIKERIEGIIRTEDSSSPYSDQDISNMLKQENIEIARRTVTKYRKEMNIKTMKERTSLNLK